MNVLLELTSRLLEPEERAFVLGDIAELHETGTHAVREVMGLVARRQLALWKEWRPWIALLGMVGIVGPILRAIIAEVTLPFCRDITTYWKVGSLYSSGMTIGEEFLLSLILAVGVLLWSWTGGFVLAHLSGKAFRVTAFLYFVMAMAPFTPRLLFAMRSSHFHLHLLVAAIDIGASVCFFVYPSVRGLRCGLRDGALSSGRAALLSFLIFCITGIATWSGGWPNAAVTRWSGGAWNPGLGWQSRFSFYVVLAWPVSYLFLTAKRRRRTSS
jgi:hypothetical protein